MKRYSNIVFALVIGLLLVNVMGCAQIRNGISSSGIGCDNTARFTVGYRGNPVAGAYVYIAELDITLMTDNQGVTDYVCTGSYGNLSGTVAYGQLSNTWGTGLGVGDNTVHLGF